MNDKENNNETEKNSTSLLDEILQWVNAVVLALIIAFVIRGLIFEPVMVIGDSMQDTLQDRQRLIVYKLGYYFELPKRGEIVVLQHQAGIFENIAVLDDIPIFRKAFPDFNEINYIKRAIGLPGDNVDIKDGKVYVNGEMLTEPYIKGDTSPLGMKFPVEVPKDTLFVLGDNREHSGDSRTIGFVKLTKIKGRAVYSVFPFDTIGTLDKR